MPFQKGVSGNPTGRPKGSGNKSTAEIKAFAEKVLTSQEWQANVYRRMLDGKAPHIETYLLQLYAGKPKDTVAIEDRTPRALVIDRVNTRAELLAVLGGRDTEAGGDDDEDA